MSRLGFSPRSKPSIGDQKALGSSMKLCNGKGFLLTKIIRLSLLWLAALLLFDLIMLPPPHGHMWVDNKMSALEHLMLTKE
jgi:hypothetical protein